MYQSEKQGKAIKYEIPLYFEPFDSLLNHFGNIREAIKSFIRHFLLKVPIKLHKVISAELILQIHFKCLKFREITKVIKISRRLNLRQFSFCLDNAVLKLSCKGKFKCVVVVLTVEDFFVLGHLGEHWVWFILFVELLWGGLFTLLYDGFYWTFLVLVLDLLDVLVYVL